MAKFITFFSIFFVWAVAQTKKAKQLLGSVTQDEGVITPDEVSVYTDPSYGADADGNRGVAVSFIESYEVDLVDAFMASAISSLEDGEVKTSVSIYDWDTGIDETVDLPDQPVTTMRGILWWADTLGTETFLGIYWEEVLFLTQYLFHEKNRGKWSMKVDY